MRKSFIVLLCLSVITLVGCSRRDIKEVKQPVRHVKTEQVGWYTDENKVDFNGKVRERREIDLSFRVSGPIVYLPVKEGQFVNKDEVIARIDPRDYQLQLEASKAQYEQLKEEYARSKELFELGKIPANGFEKIRSGYLRAKADYEHSLDQLADTQLKAPVSGYIHKKNAGLHETILQGVPIVSLIDVSDMEVSVFVSESQLSVIANATMVCCDIPNAAEKGCSLTKISVDKKSGRNDLYEVRYSLGAVDNNKILSGMSCRVFVTRMAADSLIRIPVNALWNDANDTYVWLYCPQDSSVVKSVVRIGGDVLNGRVEVLEGVAVGQEVVTAGVHSVVPGMKAIKMSHPSKTNVGGVL